LIDGAVDFFVGDADASRLQPLDDPPDVVRTVPDPGADQAAGGIHAKLVVDPHRGRAERLGEMAGSKAVGDLIALISRQRRVLEAGDRVVSLAALCGRPRKWQALFVLPERVL